MPVRLSRSAAVHCAGGVAVVAATPSSQEGARGAPPRLGDTNCLVRLPFGDEASPSLSATGRRSHTIAAPIASLQFGTIALFAALLAAACPSVVQASSDDAIQTDLL